jgi:hypothetical protein
MLKNITFFILHLSKQIIVVRLKYLNSEIQVAASPQPSPCGEGAECTTSKRFSKFKNYLVGQ